MTEKGDGEMNVEQSEQKGEEAMSYGFNPLEQDLPKKEEVREVTPEMRIVITKINKLLCRYSTLVPRSSGRANSQLEKYSLEELNSVYENCITDLQAIRGTPTSEFAINLFAGTIDNYLLPGYLDVCMDDVELNRDIEAEMLNSLYTSGTRTQIIFRLINNAYKVFFGRETNPNMTDHVDHGDEPREGGNPALDTVIRQEEDCGDEGDYDEQESKRTNKRARASCK